MAEDLDLFSDVKKEDSIDKIERVIKGINKLLENEQAQMLIQGIFSKLGIFQQPIQQVNNASANSLNPDNIFSMLYNAIEHLIQNLGEDAKLVDARQFLIDNEHVIKEQLKQVIK